MLRLEQRLLENYFSTMHTLRKCHREPSEIAKSLRATFSDNLPDAEFHNLPDAASDNLLDAESQLPPVAAEPVAEYKALVDNQEHLK